jgi:hypothetical protein
VLQSERITGITAPFHSPVLVRRATDMWPAGAGEARPDQSRHHAISMAKCASGARRLIEIIAFGLHRRL